MNYIIKEFQNQFHIYDKDEIVYVAKLQGRKWYLINYENNIVLSETDITNFKFPLKIEKKYRLHFLNYYLVEVSYNVLKGYCYCFVDDVKYEIAFHKNRVASLHINSEQIGYYNQSFINFTSDEYLDFHIDSNNISDTLLFFTMILLYLNFENDSNTTSFTFTFFGKEKLSFNNKKYPMAHL